MEYDEADETAGHLAWCRLVLLSHCTDIMHVKAHLTCVMGAPVQMPLWGLPNLP